VDARDMSAFTRVFDALCAGMTIERVAVSPWTDRTRRRPGNRCYPL